jgi:hypothetical protein
MFDIHFVTKETLFLSPQNIQTPQGPTPHLPMSAFAHPHIHVCTTRSHTLFSPNNSVSNTLIASHRRLCSRLRLPPKTIPSQASSSEMGTPTNTANASSSMNDPHMSAFAFCDSGCASVSERLSGVHRRVRDSNWGANRFRQRGLKRMGSAKKKAISNTSDESHEVQRTFDRLESL